MGENVNDPLLPKNTSAQCYRVNDMFKPKLAFLEHPTNDMFKQKQALLECPTCQKFYKSEASLKKHLKLHLPGYKKRRPRTAKELAEICKFQCETCGKRFIRKCGLKRHMIVHEVIRSCEGCGKKCKDSQAHYKHKQRCKAYTVLYLKKTQDKAHDQKSNTTGWIETTEEYLSVYQHKCQMCEARFAFREHLDTHTEHCNDAFLLVSEEEQLKLLYERNRKNNAKRIRKEAILKVIKKNRKGYNTNGHKRIKAEQMRRIRRLNFHSSVVGFVSLKVRYKYNNTQKRKGKNSKEQKKALAKFKSKIHQRLLRSQQIIERDTWYKCTLCGAFGRAETIVHHLKSPVHHLQMPVICGACNKDFLTLQRFRFHQALHKHKINNNTLVIRYTTNIHAETTKQVLSRNEKVKNSPCVTLKTDEKKIITCTSKRKSIKVGQFESKCLCGIVFRDVKKMATHVGSSHNLILGFKCKCCVSNNIFHNIVDFSKHLTSEHKRRKGQIYQSDFKEKFLLPIGGSQGANMLVNSMTCEGQSSSTTAVSDIDQEAQRNVEKNVKQEHSDELTESQLLAKQEEFVKIGLRQMIPEKIWGKSLNEKVRKSEMRKRPLLIEQNTANAKEWSAAKKRRIECKQMKEKSQETATKIRAKQCLRKYKSILGWKLKKNNSQSRLSVRNGQRVEKVSEETKAVLSGNFPSQCHLCKKLLQSQAALLSHIKYIHNLSFGYKCRSCDPGIVFMHLQEFYNHLKSVHCKYNLSIDEVEQVTVIKLENSGQVSANSKPNVALSQTNTSVSPGVPYKSVDLKGAQACAQSDNNTTQITAKRRQIRPKYDPDFEYGNEATVLIKRQKLEFQKRVIVQDQNGKEVTIMIKGEPVDNVNERKTLGEEKGAQVDSVNERKTSREKKDAQVDSVNERKTSREEHICRVCRKHFRLKIMLNQHLKTVHKLFPSENRETRKEKVSKRAANLKANVESHMKDVNLKQNDIAKFVTISENDMFMSSVYQNRQEEENSQVNSVNIKKKYGGKKSSQDDHNYFAKNLKQEPNEKKLLHCPSKHCEYKCKTASTLKRHMRGKHDKETNLQIPVIKSVEPYDSGEDVKEDIDSGDSDLADMVDTVDSDYKLESDLADMMDQDGLADITNPDDMDYKVESETALEGKSKGELKTVDIDQKLSHADLEREMNKISSLLGKFSKSLCKPSTHKYYCPFCAEQRYSSTYEEIRDHIDKVHLEATLQETGEKHDNIKVESSGQTVDMTEALEITAEKSDDGPEPPRVNIGSKSPKMETEIDNDDPQLVSSGPSADGDGDPQSGQNADGLAERQSNEDLGSLTSVFQEPTVHAEVLAPATKNPVTVVTTKRFECVFCQQTFKREFTRNIHKLDHTDETLKAHVCGLCGFSYHKPIRLRRHMQLHSETGSFKCDMCSRQFKTQAELDWHVSNTHSRDYKLAGYKERKSFECTLCQVRFSSLKVARRHAKQKHKALTNCERGKIIRHTDAAGTSQTTPQGHIKFEKSKVIGHAEAAGITEPTPTSSNKHLDSTVIGSGLTVSAARGDTAQKHSGLNELERNTPKRRQRIDKTSNPTPTPKKDKSADTTPNPLNKPFECTLCGLGFLSVKTFRRHARDKHSDISVAERHKAVRRTTIKQRTTEQSEADEAVSMQERDETGGSEVTETGGSEVTEKVKASETKETVNEWECEHCPFTTNRPVNLRNHVQKVHVFDRVSVDHDTVETDAEVEDRDHSDGEKVVKKQARNTRETWDNGLMYKCTIDSCGKIFTSRKFFTDHRKIDHSQLINFRCSLCMNDYAQIHSLKVHVAQSHIAADRVPLQMIAAEVFKQNSSNTSQKAKIDSDNDTEIMICVRCSVMGRNDTLDCHRCLPKVPVFYCPCCDNPKSVFSENWEVVREHIRKEHELDVETQAGDVVASEQADTTSRAGSGDHSGETITTAEKRFYCGHCNQVFDSQFDKNMHEIEHTGVQLQRYVCGLCGLSYPRSSAYDKHSLSHRESKYKCSLCPKAFLEKSDLDRHTNTHTGERPFQCDICGNRYCDIKECKKHMKLKHPEIYYERYAPLQRGQCVTGGDIVCDQCGQVFKTSRQWKQHSFKVHEQKKPELACSLCPDKKFRTRKMLNKHLQQHNHDDELKKQVKEETPDPKLQLHEKVKLALNDSDSLRLVYKQLHIFNQNDKDGLPHMCSVCSKKFRKVKYLYIHIREVHANDKSKKYICRECGRGFVRTSSFRIHMRTHTNSRPFKCRLCSKTFKQRGHVKEHLRSHSSLYKTCCSICGKAFKARGSRNAHIITHCKIKPFCCPVCPLSFAEIGQLMDHFSDISHTKGQQKENTLRKFNCPICTTFQCENRHDMLRHFDNHTMEKHFQCEKCNVRFTKYMELYHHKEKHNHFVESDFEGVQKFTSQSVLNHPRNIQHYDHYTLEEIQLLFDVEPDNSELSQQELDEMMNPDGLSVYDHGHWEVSRQKKHVPQGTTNMLNRKAITQTDLDEIEYSEMSEEESEIEYEADLLTVAEQLTHMANRDTKSALATVDGTQDIFTPANQLQLDSSFDIGSPWSTPGFVIKPPSQKKSVSQKQQGRFNADINPTVIQPQSYMTMSHEETVSATNVLLQKNEVDSGFSNINSIVASTSVKGNAVQSPIKPAVAVNKSQVQPSYQSTPIVVTSKPVNQVIPGNIINNSGHETIVYILDGTAESNDILNILESVGGDTKAAVSVSANNPNAIYHDNNDLGSDGSKLTTVSLDGVLEKEENELDTGLHVTVGDWKMPVSAQNRPQSDVSTDRKTVSSNLNSNQHLTERNLDNLEAIEEAHRQVILDSKQDPDYRPDNSSEEESDEDGEKVKDNTNGAIKYQYKPMKIFNKPKENSGDYQCGLCLKRFRTNKLRNVHAKTHLPDHLQKFRCTECGKGFSRNRSLQMHVLIHTGERNWQCEICDRSFSQQGHLLVHKRSHLADKPFKCSQCSWTGVTGSMLRRHIQEKHVTNNRIKCHSCDKTFVDPQNLKRHAVTHLSQSARDNIVAKASSIIPKDKDEGLTKQSESQMDESLQSAAKIHICDVCGKTYSTASSLFSHRQKHLEGDDFKCEDCGRGFPTQLTLSDHKKCHKAREPIPCDRCGKLISTKHGLKKHIQMQHEGKKKEVNFKCLKCKKGFHKEHHFLCHVSVCCPKQAGCILSVPEQIQ